MNHALDIDDFPPGTPVITPMGRKGVVVKARGSESKRDHFQRLVVKIGPRARDTVTLQPGLLRRRVETKPFMGESETKK